MASLQYGTYYSGQNNKRLVSTNNFLVIGLIAAVLIGGLLIALASLNGNNKNDVTLLAVRENSLLRLLSTSQATIQNSDLVTANSNATVLLTSDVASLSAAIGIKTLPSNLVKQEADTNASKLKQAQLLANFDSTYQQIVLNKVTTLVTEAQTVSKAASSANMRTAVDQATSNLQSIEKQFTQLQIQ